MKIPVYVRATEEAFGLFVGHAEHSELPEVIQLFNRDPEVAPGINLPSDQWHNVYMDVIDADDYQFVGAQFAAQGKNLVFEIILGPHI